jgi:hypothetical protein
MDGLLMRDDRWVAAARPKALPMANGQTIGKLPLAAATRRIRCLGHVPSKTIQNHVPYVIASVAKQSPIPGIEIASSLRCSQ